MIVENDSHCTSFRNGLDTSCGHVLVLSADPSGARNCDWHRHQCAVPSVCICKALCTCREVQSKYSTLWFFKLTSYGRKERIILLFFLYADIIIRCLLIRKRAIKRHGNVPLIYYIYHYSFSDNKTLKVCQRILK